MEIKLSPLVMFLLILSVLAVSMVIGNYFIVKDAYNQRQMENFITFNYNNASTGSSVKIAPYSSITPVVQVYDSLYFDSDNANVLEVFGNIVPVGGSVDTGNINLTVNSINQINVLNRMGNTPVTYDSTKLIATNGAMQTDIIKEGRKHSTSEAYDQWSYTTRNGANSKYSLIYIPWTMDTYLHVIDSAGNNVLSMMQAYETSNTTVLYSAISTKPTKPMGQTSITSSANDGKFITNSSYNTKQQVNKKIYQVTSQVFYDPSGYIYVQQDPNSDGVVYDRTGNSLSPAKSLSGITQFTSWVTPQSATQASGSNGPFVLVMSIAYKTVLAVLTSNGSGFSAGKVVKFAGKSQTIDSTTNDSKNDDDDDDDDDYDKNTWHGSNNYKYSYNDVFNKCGSDFSKWGSQCWQKFYQLSYTSSGSLINTNVFSDDYILKTQVVPPVCPSCPSCPNTAGNVCTNCGGGGGSGTGGTGEKNMAVSGSISDKGADINAVSGDNVTTKGNGKFATNADTSTVGGSVAVSGLGVVSGVENVAKTGADVITSSVGAVGGLAGNVVNSATGIVKDTGSGVKEIVKDTGSGAYNLVTGAASGANSLVRDTASGVVNLGKDRDDIYRGNDSNNSGYSNSGYSSSYNRNGEQSSNTNAGSQVSDSTYGRINTGKGTPIDNYSYYGALQSKGNTNFMPVTADFSNFRK